MHQRGKQIQLPVFYGIHERVYPVIIRNVEVGAGLQEQGRHEERIPTLTPGCQTLGQWSASLRVLDIQIQKHP